MNLLKKRTYATLLVALFLVSFLNVTVHANASGITTAPNCYAEVIATSLYGPHNIAIDKAGNLYVPNEGYTAPPDYPAGTIVTEITPDGQVSTFATGFVGPSGIAIDEKGHLWVSDDGHAYGGYGYNVWKVASDGTVEPGSETFFGNPNTLAFDKDWNLYVVATSGGIYKIDPSGTVSLFADGFFVPQALAFDNEGFVYTADADGTIWKLDPSGSTRVFYAKVNGNQGNFAFDKDGNLYVPEYTGKIVVVTPTGGIKTLVQGLGVPRGVAFDSSGRLYIADYARGDILRVTIGKITKNIHVYPGNSIQLAVDWASEGDKIIVHEGIYNEKVTVTKPLTLTSSGATIDLAGVGGLGGTFAGIFVSAPGVTVSGFTIINVPFGLGMGFGICYFGEFSGGLIKDNEIISDQNGIGVRGVTDVEVRNNRIVAPTGILLFNTPNVVVKNNVLQNSINLKYPPWLQPIAINVEGDMSYSGISIHNNRISSEGFGVGIGTGSIILSEVEVKNNQINSALNGISANNAPNIVLRNNVVFVHGTGTMWLLSTGISVNNGGNAVVRENVVECKTTDPLTQASMGIYFGGSFSGGLIKSNEVTLEDVMSGLLHNNKRAIVVGGPTNIQIINNIVYKSTHGISIFLGADEVVTGNTIYRSAVGVEVEDSPRATVSSNIVFSQNLPQGPGHNAIGVLFGNPNTGTIIDGGRIENNQINSEATGINANYQSNIMIRNNKVTAITVIGANNAPNVIIRDNVLSAKANIEYPGVIPFGILLSGSFSGGLITNNEISSERFGISLGGPSNVEIQYNTVHASTIGIGIGVGSDITIENNRVTAVTAIGANNAPNVIIRDNVVSAEINPEFLSMMPAGILLSGSFSGGLITNNEINSENMGINIAGPPSGISNIEVLNNVVYTSVTAIGAANAPNVVISNNIVSAQASATYPRKPMGIQLSGSFSGGIIENNQINSDYYGIRIGSIVTSPPPISNVEVLNNVVYTSVTAINATNAPNVAIRSNVLYATQMGIAVNVPPTVNALLNPIVSDNDVHSGDNGIILMNVVYATVQNNEVHISKGTPGSFPFAHWIGMGLTGTGSNIAYNTVSGDFFCGIVIAGIDPSHYSTDNTVLENNIAGGTTQDDIGIYLNVYTSGNSVIDNIISGVDTPILDEGSDNIKIP